MSRVEERLKEYRAIRRRKEIIENAKEKLQESKEKLATFLVPKFLKDMGKEEEVLLMENEEIRQENENIPQKKYLLAEPESPSDVASEVSEMESIAEEDSQSTKYIWWKRIIIFTIWFIGYLMALYTQFGAVYFVITLFVFICFNTSTRPRKRGEVSAYSVFNENCVSIDGTLKAEQFEREIRFGPGSVR